MDSFFDQYTSFYFYSAAFQGNIALMAFAGLFTTYKLQLLKSDKSSVVASLKEIVTSHYGRIPVLVPAMVIDSFLNPVFLFRAAELSIGNDRHTVSRKMISEELSRDENIATLLSHWRASTEVEANIKVRFTRALTLAALSVMVSLILLPISSWIHACGPLFEGFLIIAYIGLNIWAIRSNVKLTRYSLLVHERKFFIPEPVKVAPDQIRRIYPPEDRKDSK
jgi:hypothetical protein